MSENHKGILITFEGLEGSGKSTNAQFATDYLMSKGIEVIPTREPGGTVIGQTVRSLLLEDQDEPIQALTELYLMFASRAQLLKTLIGPELKKGKWVICDRYVDSSFAYQGGGRGIDSKTIDLLVEGLGEALYRPDLTFFLDIDPSLIQPRLKSRRSDLSESVVVGDKNEIRNQSRGQQPDRFEREDIEFFSRIREVYKKRALEMNMVTIDANRSLIAVENAIQRELDALLEKVKCAE